MSSELSYRCGRDRPPFNGRVLHQNTLASGMGGPERIARAESQEGEPGVFADHFSGPKIGPFFGPIFQATRRVTHCSAPKAERVHHGFENMKLEGRFYVDFTGSFQYFSECFIHLGALTIFNLQKDGFWGDGVWIVR